MPRHALLLTAFCCGWCAAGVVEEDVEEALDADAGDGKWEEAVIARNGAVYGIPTSASSVLKLDRATDQVTTFGDLGAGGAKWLTGVVARNGMIYALPYGARSVLKIDPVTDSATTFGDLGDSCCKWRRIVVARSGAIYGVPSYASGVLKVDPATDRVTTLGDFGSSALKWLDAVLVAAGPIYAIPYSAAGVLKINPLTDAVTMFGDVGRAPGKWKHGVLASNGMIYGIPASAGSVLKINPFLDRATTFGDLGYGGQKWLSSFVAATGAIYSLPFSATAVLKIVPATDTVTEIRAAFRVPPGRSAGAGAGAAGAPVVGLGQGGRKWKGGLLVGRGHHIVGWPHTAASVLLIDVPSDSIFLLGNLSQQPRKWKSGFIGGGGSVYAIPADAQQILKFDPRSYEVTLLGHFSPMRRKWGVAVAGEDADTSYGIPLSATSVLKIDAAADVSEEIGELSAGSGTWERVVECNEFECTGGSVPQRDAATRICSAALLCDQVCCLQKHRYRCPPGYRPSAEGFSNAACLGGTIAEADLGACCSLDASHPSLVLPFLGCLVSALACGLRSTIRCKVERLDQERAFQVAYFTLVFIWDVCDQLSSWWFWQYTVVVGASASVQAASLLSSLIGTAVTSLAFTSGLCMPTRMILGYRILDFAYSIGAGLSDLIMLVTVFIFEMQGFDVSGWIKILNLMATIFDLVLKVLQAAWAVWGSHDGEEEEEQQQRLRLASASRHRLVVEDDGYRYNFRSCDLGDGTGCRVL